MYREQDLIALKKNKEKIYDDIILYYKTRYEPTINESYNVIKNILKFIKKKKRIIYGGYALNLIIMNKNSEDYIYRKINNVYFNFPEIADLEFYSPTPVQDIIELANELYKLNFKQIDVKEGIHPETFKLFINFIGYCDITYLPSNIFYNINYININELKCVHPKFILLDMYKILTDPYTSYWRLDKILERINKLTQYYPLRNIKFDINKLFISDNNNEILKFIKLIIMEKSKYITIGYYAYNYYIKKLTKKYIINNIPYIELISSNIKKDGYKIYKILKLKYKNVTIKQYNKFSGYIDNKIEYYVNNNLVLILYGNYNRCILYKYSKKEKIYYGSFTIVIMYFLFFYYYNFVNKNKIYCKLYKYLIGKLFLIRNKYLIKKNITVINISPFQEFTVKCIGKHLDIKRNYLIENLKKYKEKKQVLFKYTPNNKTINNPIPQINFDNTSGNIIINKKKYIINI